MTVGETICALRELERDGEIEILSESDQEILVFDPQDGKEICYNKVVNRQKLVDNIYINENIPGCYHPNKAKVAEYLLSHLPSDAFHTLNKICFVCKEKDDEEGWYEKDCVALAEMFDEDEDWVREIVASEFLGKMWFEYNSVLVDVGNIMESALEIEAEDIAMGFPGNVDVDIRRQIAITLVHELRHLMLDTNIVLYEDEYSSDLNSEENVEEFARCIVDINGFDIY